MLDHIIDVWAWLIRHYPVSFPMALGYIGFLIGHAVGARQTEKRWLDRDYMD